MHELEYVFKWRRLGWFQLWHSLKVIGHNYDEKNKKMILYFSDRSIREIAQWDMCEVYLGPDWKFSVESSIRAESGNQ